MKVAERKDTGVSLAASIDGAAFGTKQMLNYSVEAVYTDGGSLSGTLKLQACNNAYEGPVGNEMYLIENPNASWEDVAGSSIAITGSGIQLFNVSEVSYKAYRLVYTRTAGTGIMNVYHFAKGRI